MFFITQQSPRHKVFVSYHHAGDEPFKATLSGTMFRDAYDDLSVRPLEVDDGLSTERTRQIIRDEYIRDATVTLVLVGAGTWRRKYVDWEIDSSLRDTKYNSRTGLLGIILPTYRLPAWEGVIRANYPTEPNRETYCPNNIPPRLWDNIKNGFAKMRPWPTSATELREWIHEAFRRRDLQPNPYLSRPTFSNNRSEATNVWDPPVR
jgi:hypothetical protein